MFLNPALYTRAQNYDPMVGVGDEISEGMNYKRFLYDFATQGGAVGTQALVDEQGNPAVLPLGSVVMSVMVDMITAVTSGGAATVAIGCNGTTDLLGATAKASLASGLVAGVPVMSAATAVKVVSGSGTAATITRKNFSVVGQAVTATIATAALTAGRFYVHVVFARGSAT
jgi:hypothetical protein